MECIVHIKEEFIVLKISALTYMLSYVTHRMRVSEAPMLVSMLY